MRVSITVRPPPAEESTSPGPTIDGPSTPREVFWVAVADAVQRRGKPKGFLSVRERGASLKSHEYEQLEEAVRLRFPGKLKELVEEHLPAGLVPGRSLLPWRRSWVRAELRITLTGVSSPSWPEEA